MTPYIGHFVSNKSEQPHVSESGRVSLITSKSRGIASQRKRRKKHIERVNCASNS